MPRGYYKKTGLPIRKGKSNPIAGFQKGHKDLNPSGKWRIKKGEHRGVEWKKGETPKGSILFKKGTTPWNKGKKGEYHIWKNGREFTKEWKDNIRDGHIGIKYPNRKKGIKFTE